MAYLHDEKESPVVIGTFSSLVRLILWGLPIQPLGIISTPCIWLNVRDDAPISPHVAYSKRCNHIPSRIRDS